jgi:hypothetical protein
MDLFGPLKTSESGKIIMCITDAFLKFAELIAIPDKCAETVANAFFTRWLCRDTAYHRNCIRPGQRIMQ